MKILITGSSGFVGTHLTKFLLDAGHEITGIDARKDNISAGRSLFHFVQADTTKAGDWRDALKNQDVAFNLAGINIFRRWTKSYKQLMYDSRILTTRHLVDALPDRSDLVFISTSAVGFYGDRNDVVLEEGAFPGQDFLADLCVNWEKEAVRAKSKGVRVVIMRFGVILGKKGGALSKMMPAYRMFVGGPLGDGMQWFSWIHIDDLLSAMKYLMEHPEVEGPVNFCAPKPVRNKDFSRTLAHILNRPAFFRVPAWMMRTVAGELGNLALFSQRVYPAKLLNAGFKFKHSTIDSALSAIIL